ncbi:MAG: CAP domain-containing protein [Candidatus Gracilibacteria bacterium]|nr:CAP domain-containing protein [Candidatus Gracilibacteria bacterium]
MKKLCALLIFFSIFFLNSITVAHAQRAPVFLQRKIVRLESTYKTKCDNNTIKRVCQIIQFRIDNVTKQITLFLLREQDRKATAKQDINLIEFRNEVIELTNQERLKEGLTPLRYNKKLETSAQLHTDDMEKNDYFAHASIDGREPFNRIEDAGYLEPFHECKCSKSYTVGENIAKGQTTPEQVMKDWMNSPDHKENILNPDYDEIGIGISGNYWGQNFGNISLVK